MLYSLRPGLVRQIRVSLIPVNPNVFFPGAAMRNLFRSPAGPLLHDIETAVRAISETTPLPGRHAKELPFAVRDLSRMLTEDRSQISASYWINKRLLTAYCRYFLPWNLIRLSWMLPGLDLPMPKDGVILDLGSGPLTVPLALWLAKPAWRDLPLTIVCCDVAPGPLTLGHDIFSRLAPGSAWKIRTVRSPLEKALREFAGNASLITAANVLNEVRPSRETPLPNRMAALTRLVASRLAPEGRFLAVEPGTRLGGKLMALIRQMGFSSRLVPEGPCTHWGPCPMLAERTSGWCHFSHIASSAPAELKDLARKAGLGKDTLSLSCMLLRPATDEETRKAEACLPKMIEDDIPDDDFFDNEECDDSDAGAWAEAFAATCPASGGAGADFARVLSDPIRLPDVAEPARYACSVRGLLLARDALRMPSGAVFAVTWPEKTVHDTKSGALIVDPSPSPREKTRPGGGRPGAGKPCARADSRLPAKKTVKKTVKKTTARRAEPGKRPLGTRKKP